MISKSDKEISILEFKALNPILTIIESHGGYRGSKEKTAEEHRELIKFANNHNISYISVDLSNNGTQPDQPVEEMSLEDRVKDLETIIDYATTPVILIGTSFGGYISLKATTSKIKAIILNCSIVRDAQIPQVPILWFHGTRDRTAPINEAFKARRSNSNITLVIVPNATHKLQMKEGQWEKETEKFILSIASQ